MKVKETSEKRPGFSVIFISQSKHCKTAIELVIPINSMRSIFFFLSISFNSFSGTRDLPVGIFLQTF